MEFFRAQDEAHAVGCCFGKGDNSVHAWNAFIGWKHGVVRCVKHTKREGTREKLIVPRNIDGENKLNCIDITGSQESGECLAVGYKSGYIDIHRNVWAEEENDQCQVVHVNTIVNSVRFKPASADTLVFAGKEGTLGVLSLAHETVATYRTLHGRNPITEAVPISENLIVTSSLDNKVALTDLREQPGGTVLMQATSWVYSVDATENSWLVASGSRDKIARTADMRFPLGVVHQYEHAAGVTSCVLSGNEELLLTGSTDQTVAAWRPGQVGELERIVGCFNDGIACVDLSLDRQLALVACHDGTGRVFDIAHRKRLQTSALEEETALPSVIADRVCGFLW